MDLIPWVAQGVCASLGECVVPGKDLACPTDALILCSGRNGESFNPQPQEAKTKAQPQPTGLQLDVLPLCPSASSEQIALAGLVPPVLECAGAQGALSDRRPSPASGGNPRRSRWRFLWASHCCGSTTAGEKELSSAGRIPKVSESPRNTKGTGCRLPWAASARLQADCVDEVELAPGLWLAGDGQGWGLERGRASAELLREGRSPGSRWPGQDPGEAAG